MSINWLVFGTVVIVQYVVGALWYSVVFGKQWMQINHPEGTPSKKELQEMEKQAGPLYGVQILLTVSVALIQLYIYQKTSLEWLTLALLLWSALVVMSVQNIIWSDPKNKQKPLQIFIIATHMLVNLLIAGWAFATFK